MIFEVFIYSLGLPLALGVALALLELTKEISKYPFMPWILFIIIGIGIKIWRDEHSSNDTSMFRIPFHDRIVRLIKNSFIEEQ